PRRFAIRENLIALREPASHLAFQHRLTIGGRKPFAVTAPPAALAIMASVVEEIPERVARFVAVESVQAELALHGPMPAPQPDEHVARKALAQEGLLRLDLLTHVPTGGGGLDGVLAR